MKIVHFNPELSARAPDLLGVFCVDPSGQWLTLQDIEEALASGAYVEIRQASATENERAEAVVVLYEIELQLARQVGALLDQSDETNPRAAEMEAATSTLEAVESYFSPPAAITPEAGGKPSLHEIH